MSLALQYYAGHVGSSGQVKDNNRGNPYQIGRAAAALFFDLFLTAVYLPHNCSLTVFRLLQFACDSLIF